MKSVLKLFTLFLVCVLFFNGTTIKCFEGKIFFKSIKPGKKEVYVYYVKDDKVRLDQISDGVINGTYLVNSTKQEIFGLTPKHKLYVQKEYKDITYPRNENIEVIKTGKIRSIHGYNCEEVKVNDKEKDSYITYYISQKNFDFFRPLLQCLNRKEMLSINYFQVEGMTRDFPFFGVDKSSNGMEKHRLEVTLISEEEISDDWFEIPHDFSEQKR